MEKTKTKREIKTQQTREKILDAALRLFRRYGFEKTSIQDICQEAGVAVGSLYHLFASKHEIINCILKDVDTFYDPNVTFDYAHDDMLVFCRKGAGCFMNLIHTLTPEVVFKALFSSPDGNKTMFYKERSNIVWLQRHLKEFQKAGRIHAEVDIDELVYQIVAAGIGLFYGAYTMETIENLEEKLVDMYMCLLHSVM